MGNGGATRPTKRRRTYWKAVSARDDATERKAAQSRRIGESEDEHHAPTHRLNAPSADRWGFAPRTLYNCIVPCRWLFSRPRPCPCRRLIPNARSTRRRKVRAGDPAAHSASRGYFCVVSCRPTSTRAPATDHRVMTSEDPVREGGAEKRGVRGTRCDRG